MKTMNGKTLVSIGHNGIKEVDYIDKIKRIFS